MSKERNEHVVNKGIDRRQFFAITATWLGIATASSIDLSWIADIPEALPEKQIPYPLPGWLETSFPDRPPLVTPQQGHKDYLRFFCLNHPVLKDALFQAYSAVFSINPSSASAKLGDCLSLHLNYARNSLSQIMGDKNPSWTSIVHVASMTLAGVLSPYISPQEIENLGVNIPKGSPLEKGVVFIPEYNQFVPKVFPAKPETCSSKTDIMARCEGGDRADHFAQHLFLTHQMLYVLMNNLQDAHRIPNGASLAMKLGGSKERQAAILDASAQVFWEGLETYDYFFAERSDYGRGENGQKIPSGFVDSYVDRDFMANQLGQLAGFSLSKNPITWGNLNEVMIRLNNPAYYKVI